MAEAVDLAQKGLAKQGTPLRGRFPARAQYVYEADRDYKLAVAMEGFAKGAFWLITFRDPEYNEEYPIAPIRVLVFSDKRVAILSPL